MARALASPGAAFVAVLVGVAVGTVGCGSDLPLVSSPGTPVTAARTGADGPVATTTTATPTTPVWTPEQRPVADAYVAFIAAFQAASVAGDPASSQLERTATGSLLFSIRGNLAKRAEQGIAARAPAASRTRPVVLSVTVTADTAQLISCDVDDVVLFKVSDGSVVDDKVATRRLSARLERASGVWRVAAREPVGEALTGEEVERCRVDA